MKKFSFLLAGVFLLGTISFALAEESKDVEVATGTTVEVATGTTVEVTTGDTVEVATGDTVEATTGDTAEATTGDTAEVATGDTAEATTGDTAEVATGNTVEAATGDTAEVTDTTTSTGDDSAKSKYSEEQVAAYEWALENGITTINDIEKARLSDGLTRAELAKMMSQYMTKVMGKTPVDAEQAGYGDVNESLGDLADYIQTAYAYKIMGINADGTPIKNFNPSGKVTRAEYATVFSRVLYGDKYNKSEGNYYEDHINALKEAGILTTTTPTIQEVRGWVMLMMYRSSNAKVEAEATTGIANPASVYCEQQGGTLKIETSGSGDQTGLCMFKDGSYCEEWSYYRNECKQGEIIYNTVSDELTGSLYTEEDLKAAEKVINEEGFGKMTVKVENVKIEYMGDEKAKSELEYCKSLDAEVEECAVFESEFFIPEQDAEMAGAFEPNKTLTGYQWNLGRVNGGEWKILTMGY